MATEGHIELADGRMMSFAEYGMPEGLPVFYFHGALSSRREPLLIGDDVLTRHGLRIIAPDRPGMGRSDFQRDRGFSDWPRDVLALADHLGITRFSVVGFSAGGAYAATCAASIPERLHQVVIVSGAWRMDDPHTLAAVSPLTRTMWRLAKWAPLLLRIVLKSAGARAGKDLSQLRRQLPAADYDVFEDPARYETYGYVVREALRQGTRGVARDMRLFTRPLRISVSHITIPLHVFHGEKDANVPLSLVRTVLAGLPSATLTTYPHEAHLSTLCNHFDDVARILADTPPLSGRHTQR